jgi:signal peptidase II
MILGGAIGNLIDRVFYGVLYGTASLFYGRVVDFLDLDFFNLDIFGYHLSRWPVFNLADAAVTVGVILLLFFHRTTAEDEVSPQTVAADTSPVVSGPATTESGDVSTPQ